MLRASSILPILAAALASCRNTERSKEKVEAAIQQRLQNQTGLDLKTLDVTTTSVTFDKNLAYATVAFHPKDDPRVNSSIQMKYTLEDRDGHWVVVKVGDGLGHSMPGGMGTGGMRPGDSLGSTGPNLPPGHPAIDGSTGITAGGGPQQ